MRVGMKLTLVDDTALVGVQKLDGILDGDDVLVPLAVDLVDHCREGGRLARAGWAGDEHETAGTVADVFDDRRQPELAKPEALVGNLAGNGGPGAALIEQGGAEAGQTFDAEGEVELQVLLEAVLLRIGEHGVGKLLGLRCGEHRHVERRELPVDPDLRGGVGRDVQIGAAALDHRLQKLMKSDWHIFSGEWGVGSGVWERRKLSSHTPLPTPHSLTISSPERPLRSS